MQSTCMMPSTLSNVHHTCYSKFLLEALGGSSWLTASKFKGRTSNADFCHGYSQDRTWDCTDGRTPRWRGIPPVQELCRAGVPVALASGSTRDHSHPFGDLDMLEVFAQVKIHNSSLRSMHLAFHPRSGRLWPVACMSLSQPSVAWEFQVA